MSTHPIESWKLTAFLLNELDADEARVIEVAMAADTDLRTEIESLRRTLDRTKAALTSPVHSLELRPEQIALVEKAIRENGLTPIALSEKSSESGDRLVTASATSWASSSAGREKGFNLASRGSLILKTLAVLAASVLIVGLLMPPAFEWDRMGMRQGSEETKLAQPKPMNSGMDGLAADLGNASQVNGNRTLEEVTKSFGPAAASPAEKLEIKDPSQITDDFVQKQSRDMPQDKKTSEQLVPQMAQRINPSATREIVVAPSQASEPSVVDLPRSTGLAAAPAAPPSAGQAPASLPRVLLAQSDENSEGSKRLFESETAEKPVEQEILALSRETVESYAMQPRTVEAQAGLPVDSLSRVEAADDRYHFRRNVSPSPGGDRFEPIIENPFFVAKDQPLSTFSIDVDTASYSKIRQYLMQADALPQPNAVRIEEMINYFDYGYAGPKGEHPFASNLAVGPCPWNASHRLVRIGLQAKKIDVEERPKANLVFLLDVSGSMDEPNKLPLVKQSITLLARQLGENDRIAMVVYAGAAGCVLPSITGDRQTEILEALDKLQAGGSTNGGQGIELAYQIAREHFVSGGVNRVILCTDGDFNVGTTSNEGLIKLVESNAKSKVFLTCLGFGMGNYNDAMMEQITNRGNGTYGMIDNIREARRLMIEQLSGTLITVAKDVKIQVEFNPSKVARYRLIGYENRKLANEDFNNDVKDAGEIGAGHRVTALYEIVPIGVRDEFVPPVDELRYGTKPQADEPVSKADVEPPATTFSDEWMTLKLRYKQPEGDVSTKFEAFLKDADVEGKTSDTDFQWAASVAEFGLLLRRSRTAPHASWEKMIRRAQQAAGDDAYRLECVEMMLKAERLAK